MIKLLTLAAMVAVFGVSALGQTKECNDEYKSSQYQKWYDNRKDHQDIAFQAADEYLATCPNDDSPYKTAIKKFWDAYKAATDSASNKNKLQDAYTKKNYAEAVSVGKQVVQSEPDNLSAYIIIALSGYNATTQGNMSLLPDAEQAARRAMEMIDAGKSFGQIFTSKDSALGWMNYIIAKAKVKNSPEEALPYFLKAARLDPDLKKTPGLYIDLAQAYGQGPLAKLTDQYKRDFTDKPETPESKLALANIYQIMDRQIDALARAVALATANDKKNYMDALTVVYKDRNKSEAGLNELVANVLSKPLPDVPAPLTSLPSTEASNSSNNGSQQGTSNTTGNTTSTSGQKTGSTSTTGTQTGSKSGGSAKPSPSPTTPIKPKPRRSNHRRG